VCLLIVLSGIHPEHALVVAANRDELLDRPAQAMAVLRASSPRVLGGRDELAGGTWLAVNEHGVVAGLTNRPARAGRDPARRSRGELPLALATHTSAELAVEAFATDFRPSDYNAAWVLVGDRDGLFYLDMTGSDVPVIEALAPGIHILENRPLGAPSPKVDHVRSLLVGIEGVYDDVLHSRLRAVLANHQVPSAVGLDQRADDAEQPVPVTAACVHSERYGTRWSGIVTVPRSRGVRPGFQYADGPPCSAVFVEAASLWFPIGDGAAKP
jgi:uncharacterized protein with NRDE domain